MHNVADTNVSHPFVKKILQSPKSGMRCMMTVFVLAIAGTLLAFPTYGQTVTTPEKGDSGVAQESQDSRDADEIADEVREAAESLVDESDPEESDEADEEDEDNLSGSLDDTSGSIEAAPDAEGLNFNGDLRIRSIYSDLDQRDGTNDSSSVVRGRFRVGGIYKITDQWLLGGRLASNCSTDECNPAFVLDSNPGNQSNIDDGDITLDQLYLHTFRLQKFDVAVGRLQTKFVARSGVFAKSLDRNDSHNVNVNWTDGAHVTWHMEKDEIVHLILQRNQADGTSNIVRGPIDVSGDDSRITYFLGWENLKRFGPFIQRGLDVTYIPKSLLKDGDRAGRIEDYWGIVSRFAARWPDKSSGPRLRIAGEIGYAPETPSRATMGLAGSGDTDGLAWNIAASVLDFRPNHSIGVNYGRADAGWLISPQYRENDELFEVRYLWRRSRNLAVDIRARWREEIEQLENSVRKRAELDVFARFTLGFGH